MNDNDIQLSRRKVLAGLGTIGVASAGAGLGTTAWLSDQESFLNNSLTAGTLDLRVHYQASYDQGSAGSDSMSGYVDGVNSDPAEYAYEVSDVKPGDSGQLVFCPRIVDNPAYLWIGSENGVTDYENGQTEPEAEVDETDGGSLGSPNDGEGAGELSEAVQVTVSYCEYVDGEYDVIREMNNPDDYTLADLAGELQETGFLLDGDMETEGTQAYPASPSFEEQTGPCICIEWNVPTDVGNEIQSDALEFGFQFYAEQERHNDDPTSPFATTTPGGS